MISSHIKHKDHESFNKEFYKMQIASPFPIGRDSLSDETKQRFLWFALYLLIYKKGSDWKVCVLREQSWCEPEDWIIIAYSNTRYEDLMDATFEGLEVAKEKFDTDEHIDTTIKKQDESNRS